MKAKRTILFLDAGDFLNDGELTADERYYLENQGFIDLSDLEKFEDTEIYLTDAEMEELEKKTKKELAESIIEKMKKVLEITEFRWTNNFIKKCFIERAE